MSRRMRMRVRVIHRRQKRIREKINQQKARDDGKLAVIIVWLIKIV
jgi:hypothetical protein